MVQAHVLIPAILAQSFPILAWPSTVIIHHRHGPTALPRKVRPAAAARVVRGEPLYRHRLAAVLAVFTRVDGELTLIRKQGHVRTGASEGSEYRVWWAYNPLVVKDYS